MQGHKGEGDQLQNIEKRGVAMLKPKLYSIYQTLIGNTSSWAGASSQTVNRFHPQSKVCH